MKSPGCDHCSHPLFAGIKCDICGWKAGQLHTCSYSCTRPACVLAQRNELRAKLEEYEAAATFFANSRSADEALMRQALEALKAVEPILTRMYGSQAAELPPMQIVRAAIKAVEEQK